VVELLLALVQVMALVQVQHSAAMLTNVAQTADLGRKLTSLALARKL